MCQKDCQHWDPEAPIIYAITPTYARPVQKAELTRYVHMTHDTMNSTFYGI